MNPSATNANKETRQAQTDQTPQMHRSVKRQAKSMFPFSITFGLFFVVGIFCLTMAILWLKFFG